MNWLDQLQAYMQANTPQNTRPAVNPATVIDQGLLGGRIGQIPQRAQEMKRGLLDAPRQLAQLGSPEMNQAVRQEMTQPRPADKQQWMDAGMELAGMAPVGGLVAATKSVADDAGGLLAPARMHSMDDLETIGNKWKHSGVTVDALESRNAPVITLSKLVVPSESRGKGIGTQAVKDVLSYADETGKTVALSPSTDFGGTSVARLKAFYKRLGFVENKGKHKDFTISESMYYAPKK